MAAKRQVAVRRAQLTIKARGSNAGRAPIDPRSLFALWFHAVLGGVGSGLEVAGLSREHDPYRWISGRASVDYQALNSLRSGNEALMDEVLTANVAALAAAGGHQPGVRGAGRYEVGVGLPLWSSGARRGRRLDPVIHRWPEWHLR